MVIVQNITGYIVLQILRDLDVFVRFIFHKFNVSFNAMSVISRGRYYVHSTLLRTSHLKYTWIQRRLQQVRQIFLIQITSSQSSSRGRGNHRHVHGSGNRVFCRSHPSGADGRHVFRVPRHVVRIVGPTTRANDFSRVPTGFFSFCFIVLLDFRRQLGVPLCNCVYSSSFHTGLPSFRDYTENRISPAQHALKSTRVKN